MLGRRFISLHHAMVLVKYKACGPCFVRRISGWSDPCSYFDTKGPFINPVTRDAAFFDSDQHPLPSPFVTLTVPRVSARHAVFYCCSHIFSVFWARVTLNFCCSQLRHARKFSSIYPSPLVTRDAIYERPIRCVH